VYVYNGTDGNVTVAVGDNSGEPTVWCETPPDGRDRVAVDLTGERLGGRSCRGSGRQLSLHQTTPTTSPS